MLPQFVSCVLFAAVGSAERDPFHPLHLSVGLAKSRKDVDKLLESIRSDNIRYKEADARMAKEREEFLAKEHAWKAEQAEREFQAKVRKAKAVRDATRKKL